MSSEGENAKNISSEGDDKKNEDGKDSPQNLEVDQVDKENDKSSENDEDDSKVKENSHNDDGKEKTNAEPKSDDNKPDTEKKSSKVEKDMDNDTKSEDTSEKEDDDVDEEDENAKDDDKKSVPLLDQPLELSGTRERKKVQRFNDDLPTEQKEVTVVPPGNGNGTPLGEIPRIDASISRFKNDDLKLLHRLIFKTPGKTNMIKKNIKKFNGFEFTKDSEEYSKKIASAQKFEIKQLKSICEMLDLDKKGNKEEIADRVIEFLIDPKDSGKPIGGGRPKRSAAVRANNRGYSSHDDSYSSDEKRSTRGRRDKGKRSNLKDESSSESDEEFRPSDASEEKITKNKRKRSGPVKKVQSDDEDLSEVEDSPSSEDTDEEPKTKRKKIINSKAKGKASPAKPRGRKPATPVAATTPTPKKKTPVKRGRKPAQNSSEESEQQEPEEEEGSSSEDEPLVKKPKNPQPPTDEEIKSYVKDILEGANLEEITMKTVCKQVYAHYPEFDLTHKKDYIKTTVKSLIST